MTRRDLLINRKLDEILRLLGSDKTFSQQDVHEVRDWGREAGGVRVRKRRELPKESHLFVSLVLGWAEGRSRFSMAEAVAGIGAIRGYWMAVRIARVLRGAGFEPYRVGKHQLNAEGKREERWRRIDGQFAEVE